jgi:hemerythrin superfamily protein
MKVTELLENQHREAEALFAQIESSEGAKKAALVRELAGKLAAHMRIEEEIVYPLAKSVDGDLVMESLEEHTVAAYELRRLAEAGLGHESADAKIKTLKELIEHHVAEEEKELFPKLDRALERERNEEVGAEAEARFDEIVESGYGADLFEGRSRRGSSSSRRNGRNEAEAR